MDKIFKDDKFDIYSYNCDLKSGDEIKYDISISPKEKELKNEVTELVKKVTLQEDLKKLKEEELKIYDELLKSMNTWIEKAKEIRLHEMAISYERIEEINHTNNKWVCEKDFDGVQKISNKVYAMWFRIYDNKVSYSVYINNYDADYNTWRSIKIAGQDRKKITDKEKMFNYIEGRKKAFSKLFEELNPIIPKEFESCFTVNGVLLPNYKVEE